MTIPRRSVLRSIGAGAVAGVAFPFLGSRFPSGPLPAANSGGLIRLDRNENPYGPSAKAIAAAREHLMESHRYPDFTVLQQKIAGFHKVSAEEVVLGCGSSEIFRMASDAFLAPGKKLILASPTFDLIARYASARMAETIAVPLTSGYAHDLKAMLAKADDSAGLVYICNPNNPTGSLTQREDIEDFLRNLPGRIPVVLDEAYHHYVGESAPRYASFLDRRVNDKRLIVVRTFSKIHGLAGLRIGYAVAAPEMARRLSQARMQFSLNAAGLQAAMAALDDVEHVLASAKRNTDERQEFFNRAIFYHLRMIDSHTNFAFLNVRIPAEKVISFLREKNILVGPGTPLMATHIRVSMGMADEMQEFWRAMEHVPGLLMGH